MTVVVNRSKQKEEACAEAAVVSEPVRSRWLVDLPDLSFLSLKDEKGNVPPWKWTPNEDWRSLRGILRRPGVEPSDTGAEKAEIRAYELTKCAELLG